MKKMFSMEPGDLDLVHGGENHGRVAPRGTSDDETDPVQVGDRPARASSIEARDEGVSENK